MQSRTSYFNRTIFNKNFTRFWPIWAVYLVIWFLILPFTLRDYIGRGYAGVEMVTRVNNHIIESISIGSVIIALIYGIVVSVAVFSYMHSSKSVSLYHALPIRREGLFISSFSAGLLFAVAPNVIVTVATILMGAMLGVNAVASSLIWLLATSVMNLLFFSIGALCATATGNVIAQAGLYVIMNFVVVVVEYMVRFVGSMVIFGLNVSDTTGMSLDWLSPAVYLLTGSKLTQCTYDRTIYMGTHTFVGWLPILGYLAAGIVISVIALLIYRRRRSEASGDVVAVRCLKPVFKYCLTLGMALTVGVLAFCLFSYDYGTYMTFDEVMIMTLWMVLAAIVGYIAGEMLIKKTLRVFRKKMLPGMVISLAVVILVMVGAGADVLGISQRLPEAGDIASVQLNYTGYYYDDSEIQDLQEIERVLQLHKMALDSKDELIANADSEELWTYEEFVIMETASGQIPTHEASLPTFQTSTVMNLRFTYTLKNGSVMTRRYDYIKVTPENVEDTSTIPGLYLDLCNTAQQCLRRTETVSDGVVTESYMYTVDGERVNFTTEQVRALYDAALADAGNCTANLVYAIDDEAYNRRTYYNTLEFSFSDPAEPENTVDWITVNFTIDAENILAELKKAEIPEDQLMTLYDYTWYNYQLNIANQ